MSFAGIEKLAPPPPPAEHNPNDRVGNGLSDLLSWAPNIVDPQPTTTTPTHIQARCDYCGVYGDLGICAQCGAPTRPLKPGELTHAAEVDARWRTRPAFPPNRRTR